MNNYILWKVYRNTSGGMNCVWIDRVSATDIVDAEKKFRDEGSMPTIQGPSSYLITMK